MRVLRLSNNSLTGTIPETIGRLEKLEVLGLYNNSLTGTLPSSMGKMKALRWAGLWSNNITGHIPTNFANLTNLETLYVDRNNLTSIANFTVGRLSKLNTLKLSHNNITGNISSSLCVWATNKTARRNCDFSSNNFTCPLECKACGAKCVKTDKKPQERKKKKKPDPNEDIRLMPTISRIAQAESALNETRFSELLKTYVNAYLDDKALQTLFNAFDFDKSGNITSDELDGF